MLCVIDNIKDIMNKQPTISQVAKIAKVSTQTVSRVINHRAGVAPATRERVEEAIEEIGYHPNPIARRLKYGNTHALGFILPDISNPLFGDAMKGADYSLRHSENKHYELLFYNTEGLPEREKKAIDLFVERRMEGIIIASSASEMIVEHIRKVLDQKNLIIVAVDNQLNDLDVDLVSSDNFKGAYLLTSHLISLGHTNISIITGPKNESSSIDRLAGYKAALNDNEISYKENLVFFGDWTKENSMTLTEHIIQIEPRPTAIFGCNNSMSLGALLTLKAKKIEVPEEIALVSFDDVENGDLLSPALTTTNTSWYELGCVSMKILLERIQHDGNQDRKLFTLPVELVIRESCGSQLNKFI